MCSRRRKGRNIAAAAAEYMVFFCGDGRVRENARKNRFRKAEWDLI